MRASFDLKVPGIENKLNELSAPIDVQLDRWLSKVQAHRPAGQGDAGRCLRGSLDISLAKHIAGERKRRRVAADLLAAASIRFPNEKKNRKKFIQISRGV